MARQYLGDTLDIHCGGEDNRFPHHECEIAQSEATTGKQLSRHWVHTAHLLVDGKRMAKSAGNFYTIRDVLSRGIEPQALRYALTCSRYREKLNYTEASLQSAITVVDRIKNVYSKIQLSAGDAVGDDTLVPSKIIDHYDKCFAALLDDLNTPVAFAELLAAVKAITQLIPTIEAEQAAAILKILKKFHGLLGIGAWDQKPKEAIAQRDDKLDAWIQDRIKERDDAKNRRDYVLADKIRDELHVRGIALIDTKDGTLFKRANVPAPC
jgi:cysteinyl-tRNA synthetase